MAGLINNARPGGGVVSQIFYYNHDTFSSTTDPDAIVISSGNRSNALSKHHSNDKPGNRTYVGRKYVIMIIQNVPKELEVNSMPKNRFGHMFCTVHSSYTQCLESYRAPFEILTVSRNIAAFWNAGRDQCFRGICDFHFQDRSRGASSSKRLHGVIFQKGVIFISKYICGNRPH